MSEITIKAPGRDAPGYLRRMRRAMALQERQRTEGPSAALLDELIDFVLAEAEVSAPAGVDVREALLDLSRVEWEALMSATAGGAGDANGAPVVDPPNGA